jgi:hypothetical protein
MSTRHVLLLSLVAGCTGTSSRGADACVSTIATGVAGRSTQQSDTDDGVSPNVGVPFVVFRADDPGLAQAIPAELAELAERQRADLDIGPPSHRHGRRIAVPPDRLGAPLATTTTDAQGCFAVELPPGTYALGRDQSMLWVDFTVVAGRITSCSHRSGYRFSVSSCAD